MLSRAAGSTVPVGFEVESWSIVSVSVVSVSVPCMSVWGWVPKTLEAVSAGRQAFRRRGGTVVKGRPRVQTLRCQCPFSVTAFNPTLRGELLRVVTPRSRKRFLREELMRRPRRNGFRGDLGPRFGDDTDTPTGWTAPNPMHELRYELPGAASASGRGSLAPL